MKAVFCNTRRLEIMLVLTSKSAVFFFVAPGVFFLNVAGVIGCFDPTVIDWLMYIPSARTASLAPDGQRGSNNEITVTVDADIAQATVPLRDTTSKGIFSYFFYTNDSFGKISTYVLQRG
jgi:hypothetical protein